MNHWILCFAVLFPIASSLFLCGRACSSSHRRNSYVLATVLLTSAAVLLAVFAPPAEPLRIMTIAEGVSIELRADGLSRIYGSIIALLWPLTAVYAFDYMKHEQHLNRFFAFFLISFGVACGIAFAGNLVTMYLFFELLTLATLPLVMHRMDDAARYAGKRYLIYSMTGAAFGLIGVVLATHFGTGSGFALGGTLDAARAVGNEAMLRLGYTLAFFGFGVKAALLPMSFWLPTASVAPTPVTALLHAVAVVKAGAFACIRLTFYAFGAAILDGTAAQHVLLAAVSLTIVTGSFLALRNNHLKRRLAWSTVANLSYILLGTVLMTPNGLIGASLHMFYHAFIKITLFFAVGAVMEHGGRTYIDETEDMAKRMPVTYAVMTIAGLALVGVPPLPGFFSKWAIGVSAIGTRDPYALVGVGALMVSAVLTAIYMLTMLLPAFFPKNGCEVHDTAHVETRTMNGVLLVLGAAIILLGLFSNHLETVLSGWLMGGAVG